MLCLKQFTHKFGLDYSILNDTTTFNFQFLTFNFFDTLKAAPELGSGY